MSSGSKRNSPFKKKPAINSSIEGFSPNERVSQPSFSPEQQGNIDRGITKEQGKVSVNLSQLAKNNDDQEKEIIEQEAEVTVTVTEQHESPLLPAAASSSSSSASPRKAEGIAHPGFVTLEGRYVALSQQLELAQRQEEQMRARLGETEARFIHYRAQTDERIDRLTSERDLALKMTEDALETHLKESANLASALDMLRVDYKFERENNEFLEKEVKRLRAQIQSKTIEEEKHEIEDVSNLRVLYMQASADFARVKLERDELERKVAMIEEKHNLQRIETTRRLTELTAERDTVIFELERLAKIIPRSSSPTPHANTHTQAQAQAQAQTHDQQQQQQPQQQKGKKGKGGSSNKSKQDGESTAEDSKNNISNNNNDDGGQDEAADDSLLRVSMLHAASPLSVLPPSLLLLRTIPTEILKLTNQLRVSSDDINSLRQHVAQLTELNDSLKTEILAQSHTIEALIAQQTELMSQKMLLERDCAEFQAKYQIVQATLESIDGDKVRPLRERGESLGLEINSLRQENFLLKKDIGILQANAAQHDTAQEILRRDLGQAKHDLEEALNINLRLRKQNEEQHQELRRVRLNEENRTIEQILARGGSSSDLASPGSAVETEGPVITISNSHNLIPNPQITSVFASRSSISSVSNSTSVANGAGTYYPSHQHQHQQQQNQYHHYQNSTVAVSGTPQRAGGPGSRVNATLLGDTSSSSLSAAPGSASRRANLSAEAVLQGQYLHSAGTSERGMASLSVHVASPQGSGSDLPFHETLGVVPPSPLAAGGMRAPLMSPLGSSMDTTVIPDFSVGAPDTPSSSLLLSQKLKRRTQPASADDERREREASDEKFEKLLSRTGKRDFNLR